jgi:hypothetical protein
VFFCDEAIYSKRTIESLVWAHSGIIGPTISQTKNNFPACAVVGAISLRGTVVALNTFEKSVNSDKFIIFLKKLLDSVNTRPVYLYLDNLPVHHSTKVTKFSEENNIHLLFAAPYDSNANPIEKLWFLSKKKFRELMHSDGRTKLSYN